MRKRKFAAIAAALAASVSVCAFAEDASTEVGQAEEALVKITVDGEAYDSENGIIGLEHTIRLEVSPAERGDFGLYDFELAFHPDFDEIKSDKYIFDITCDAPFRILPHFNVVKRADGKFELRQLYVYYSDYEGDIEPEDDDGTAYFDAGGTTGEGKASFTIKPLAVPDTMSDYEPRFGLSVPPVAADNSTVVSGNIEITIRKVVEAPAEPETPDSPDVSESENPDVSESESSEVSESESSDVSESESSDVSESESSEVSEDESTASSEPSSDISAIKENPDTGMYAFSAAVGAAVLAGAVIITASKKKK